MREENNIPRRALGHFESEEGFCKECGHRVKCYPGEIHCFDCDETLHHREVEWRIVNTKGGRADHVDEL